MKHSLSEIITNQKRFKRQILDHFHKDIQQAKRELREINCKDEFIQKQKKKLETSFKKYKPNKYIERFFFLNPKKDKEYYVWWDDTKQEPLMLTYGR